AEGEPVDSHEILGQAEASLVPEPPGAVEAEQAERFRPQGLPAPLGDQVEDAVGITGRGEGLADLRGDLDALRPRGGEAQEPRVLEGDRGLDGEVADLDQIRLPERLVDR